MPLKACELYYLVWEWRWLWIRAHRRTVFGSCLILYEVVFTHSFIHSFRSSFEIITKHLAHTDTSARCCGPSREHAWDRSSPAFMELTATVVCQTARGKQFCFNEESKYTSSVKPALTTLPHFLPPWLSDYLVLHTTQNLPPEIHMSRINEWMSETIKNP